MIGVRFVRLLKLATERRQSIEGVDPLPPMPANADGRDHFPPGPVVAKNLAPIIAGDIHRRLGSWLYHKGATRGFLFLGIQFSVVCVKPGS